MGCDENAGSGKELDASPPESSGVQGEGEHTQPHGEQRITLFVVVLTFFSAIGGFLFGYDTGVVSGAMLKLVTEFNLQTWQQELLVSITIAGAAVASAVAGTLNDRLGRRPVLIGSSLVFTGGAILLAVANHWLVLLAGRLVVGIGIGFASMTVPMYISESAPVHARGSLITLNNMFITGGQFIASITDGLFATVPNGWRYMLGLGAIPSFIQFVGFIFLPESPRYLVKRQKLKKAREVLQRIRGKDADIDAEFKSIEQECYGSSHINNGIISTFGQILRHGPVRRAVIVGCLLQACQQLTGINTVMYYSATIIKMAGVTDDTKAIWLAAAIAAGNFVFTLLGVYLVERSGRRKLMLGSLIGVALALGVLGAGFMLARLQTPLVQPDDGMPTTNCSHYRQCNWCVQDAQCGFCFVADDDGHGAAANGSCQPVWESAAGAMVKTRSDLWNTSRTDFNPELTCLPAGGGGEVSWNGTTATWGYEYCPTRYAWLIIAALVLYIVMFAPGMGPMPWTINAELYPMWARSAGTAAATFTNWTCNLLISMTFLSVSETHTVGRAGAFWIYMLIALICYVALYRILPETKDKSLEEAELLFEKPWFGSSDAPAASDEVDRLIQ